KESYDMIVFGLLDSHTLLSHASSVRLDSFVYTLEALQEARTRLTENGVLSLSFSILSDEMGKKIYLMMKQAFNNHPPICISGDYDGAVVFLQARDGGLTVDNAIFKNLGFKDITR